MRTDLPARAVRRSQYITRRCCRDQFVGVGLQQEPCGNGFGGSRLHGHPHTHREFL
jgi:hypothetical protein